MGVWVVLLGMVKGLADAEVVGVVLLLERGGASDMCVSCMVMGWSRCRDGLWLWRAEKS